MTKRRRLLGLVAVVAVVGLTAHQGWRTLAPQHRINHHSFEQIQKGMTRAEVEAVLGVPPGSYSLGSAAALPNAPGDQPTRRLAVWQSDAADGRLCVLFDADWPEGLVAEKLFVEYAQPPSWWQRVRGRLGW
jgi:hypothetical protein